MTGTPITKGWSVDKCGERTEVLASADIFPVRRAPLQWNTMLAIAFLVTRELSFVGRT